MNHRARKAKRRRAPLSFTGITNIQSRPKKYGWNLTRDESTSRKFIATAGQSPARASKVVTHASFPGTPGSQRRAEPGHKSWKKFRKCRLLLAVDVEICGEGQRFLISERKSVLRSGSFTNTSLTYHRTLSVKQKFVISLSVSLLSSPKLFSFISSRVSWARKIETRDSHSSAKHEEPWEPSKPLKIIIRRIIREESLRSGKCCRRGK